MKLDSNKVFWFLINLILAVGVIFLLIGLKAVWRYSDSFPATRTINVSAEGKTVVVPDIASFNFSVVTEGKDPAQLSSDNTTKINKALEFLKSQSIEAKDIKTAGYNLYPKYHYEEKRGSSFIDGYTLSQTVFVKVRNFEKIGTILGTLPNFGINEISSLNFEIEDQDKYLNIAREEAFAKAHAKAKTMARQNGTSIKRIVTFSESNGGYPGPIFYAAEKAIGGVASIPTPTIEPGSQEVKIQVNVTYELR